MFKVRIFEPRTLSWWADQRDVIDFDPPYQRRGGLWSNRDKSFLIDSIINEYDIPKLYLADFTFGTPTELNPHSRQYAVIDGKQRFEAIFDFIDGRIALNRDFVFSGDVELGLGGMSYRDLKANHPKLASRFDNYNLTVMSVITNEEGKINELFVRLNRNKTLTGPEIRNAMQGIVPELIRNLGQHSFFEDNVRFETRRAQDLDVAGKFLLTEFWGRIVETKRANLDRFADQGHNADADVDDFERAAGRVERLLEVMHEIFIANDPLLRTQGPLVPIYWLVRSVPDERDLVRPFLLRFEDLRTVNKRLARDPETAQSMDQELGRYDTLNRSINDQGSIEGRFEILLKRLREFKATGDLALHQPESATA